MDEVQLPLTGAVRGIACSKMHENSLNVEKEQKKGRSSQLGALWIDPYSPPGDSLPYRLNSVVRLALNSLLP